MASIFKTHMKGILFALVISMVGILVFSLIVQFVGVGSGVIVGVTQVIKALSIFIGVLIVIKTIEKRAWLHGAILGLVYTAVMFVILAIIDPSFGITKGIFAELIFAMIVGLVSALLLRMRKRV